MKVTCLLCYCSEGDNIPDAFHLADAVSKALGLKPNSSHGETLFSCIYKELSFFEISNPIYL